MTTIHHMRRGLFAGVLLVSAVGNVMAEPPAAPTPPAPAAPAAPAEPPVEVDPTNQAVVDAAVGKIVVIRGTITTATWSSTGKVLKIEFKGNEQSKLEAIAFSSVKPAMDQKFGGNATATLAGKEVVITGELTNYVSKTGGPTRPEVILKSVDQIEIVPGK